jgi:ABC-type multidrug transport system ATPase subunit
MIEVVGLPKRLENAKALAGLNTYVKKGSICELARANGAGKTAALKHIAGILRAGSGKGRAVPIPWLQRFLSMRKEAEQMRGLSVSVCEMIGPLRHLMTS